MTWTGFFVSHLFVWARSGRCTWEVRIEILHNIRTGKMGIRATGASRSLRHSPGTLRCRRTHGFVEDGLEG